MMAGGTATAFQPRLPGAWRQLQTSIKSHSPQKHWHIMKSLLQQKPPFPWLRCRALILRGIFSRSCRWWLAAPSPLSPAPLPLGITSAATQLPAGKLGQHRLQPLGWSHVALISNSAQATATRPGRQLQSLSNAASYKAVFCWECGLVLITTGSKPSLFFFCFNYRALKASCVSSCYCHHTSMQHVPWHVCEHSWVSIQNQRYFALQACAYNPHNLLTAKCVGLPFPVEDQRVHLSVSNLTSKWLQKVTGSGGGTGVEEMRC